jgi:hypothetical protein
MERYAALRPRNRLVDRMKSNVMYKAQVKRAMAVLGSVQIGEDQTPGISFTIPIPMANPVVRNNTPARKAT